MKVLDKTVLARFACMILAVLGVVTLQLSEADAQSKRGFDLKAEALADGEERTSQPDLWVMEVNFKSLRMIYVNLTDPRTGEKKRELVWYFVYKAVNRSLENQEAVTDTTPTNDFDLPPGASLFIPQITLITNDNGKQNIYEDQILPEAKAAIIKRERLPLKNSVEITGNIPPVASADDGDKNAIYGVAMWRGIDPRTDYFTVILNGFSNGYKYVKGPVPYGRLQELITAGDLKQDDKIWTGKGAWIAARALGDLFDETKQPPDNIDTASYYYTVAPARFGEKGAPPVWRKTLVQNYWRPGDRFRQFETEIRAKGDPQWIYRASEQPNKAFLAAADVAENTTPAQPMPNAPAQRPQSRNGISNFFKSLDRALKGDSK